MEEKLSKRIRGGSSRWNNLEVITAFQVRGAGDLGLSIAVEMEKSEGFRLHSESRRGFAD